MHIPSLPRALLAAAVALLLGTGAASAQQGGGQDAEPDPPEDARFVYIDSQELLQRAPGASEAQQTWNQELQQYQAEVQELKTELDSLQQSYQQQEEMLSEAARERKQQEIREKQAQLQQRVQELEQKAGQRQQELLSPILNRVRDVISDIRDEYGYVMVFDASASGLLAADPRLDITDLVVERLRQQQDTAAGGQGGS